MQPFLAFDHVQLAMPAGGEAQARAFYCGVLGMEEVPKPPELAGRGGAWFRSGPVQLHVGVDPLFIPQRKAHAAVRCAGFEALLERLRSAGSTVTMAGTFEDGAAHAYVDDPFGNRLELVG
jgi:catechol 2,3-dioxygenase-like lactoylglutathione lyase family enzyme